MMNGNCCWKMRDLALVVLRLIVAAIFLYAGVQKWALFDPANVPPDMAGTGMLTLLKVLAVAEPLAAVSLILGLLTQVGVIGCIIVMIGALWMKIGGGQPFPAWQIDLSLLGSLIVLLVFGPGCWSLDMLLFKGKKWATVACFCGKAGCGCGCTCGCANCICCKK